MSVCKPLKPWCIYEWKCAGQKIPLVCDQEKTYMCPWTAEAPSSWENVTLGEVIRIYPDVYFQFMFSGGIRCSLKQLGKKVLAKEKSIPSFWRSMGT